MKKEKIENLFSSMEDFSSVPPPELWDAIEKELEKPKKKKRALVWWFAAASLLVGMGIPAYLFFQTSPDVLPNSVEAGEATKTVYKAAPSPIHSSKNANTDNAVVTVTNDSLPTLPSSTYSKAIGVPTNKGSKNNGLKQAPNSVANAGKEENLSPFANKQPKSNTNTNITQLQANSAAIAATVNATHSNATNIFNASSQENKVGNAIKNEQPSTKNSNEIVLENKFIDKTTVVTATNTETKTKEQLQIQQELAILEQKAKGEEKEPKEKKDKKQEALSKWSMQVVAGLNTSQNYSNQQTLGAKGQAQQGKTYGVTTQYKLNKKWAVGSGLKLNELGQQLKGVSYYNNQMVQGAGINGVIVADKTDVNTISTNSDYVFLAQTKSIAFNPMAFSSGDIAQNLKYVELPLTVSYALFQKNKTNVHLNTGGFVGKLVANQFLLNGQYIGASNQVNDMVYGTLLTSTIQYKVFPTTHLFVEPGMNLFSSPLKEQSFNQFQWSLNFGVHFDF
ncbi:conserved hypothetical protein [Flavobacterium sp. 9R]|uniref:hypothetical protein n=1 Tax=Flavobacterium sp. 9R TaxID=2653143 RepID=UPI0012EFAD9A|nr:hypothetical protein [Flavobacterium sp. 9R]VXA93352.1 conserved hypothetical protein [Flavobacterium sp. 9R]